MKTAFLAAVLLSAQSVWAQDEREKPKKHFAYCEISQKEQDPMEDV